MLQDEDIVRLLGDLKGQTPEYPANFLAAKRKAFLGSAVALAMGVSSGEAGFAGAKAGGLSGGGAHLAATTELILKVLIVTALVAEVVAGGIIYRNRVLHKTASSPTPSSLVSQAASTQTKTSTLTPTLTLTVTPTGTITFTTMPTESGISGQNSTPTLTPIPSPTKPGKRIGQTPKPPTVQP